MTLYKRVYDSTKLNDGAFDTDHDSYSDEHSEWYVIFGPRLLATTVPGARVSLMIDFRVRLKS